jgi:hypothetical protein
LALRILDRREQDAYIKKRKRRQPDPAPTKLDLRSTKRIPKPSPPKQQTEEEMLAELDAL